MKKNNHQNIGKRSLKTTMKLLGAAFFILHSSFFIFSCSPEEFEGANANGLPTMEGADFQMTVDQETNQMVATYTPKAGTYPIWIIDGTSYSTLSEVGYTNTEAGTHTVELKLGNRNGISQAGVTVASPARSGASTTRKWVIWAADLPAPTPPSGGVLPLTTRKTSASTTTVSPSLPIPERAVPTATTPAPTA